MGNLFATTVLGALLLLSPTTARQTAEYDIGISPSDAQIVTTNATSNSTNLDYQNSALPIQPIQKEIINESEVHEPTNPHPKLEALITKYAAQYGARKDIMLTIMQCESGGNPKAVNGSFGGLFQFLTSTWVSNRKAMGENPDPALRFNPEEAIKTAAYKMGRDGYSAWPACSAKAFETLTSR